MEAVTEYRDYLKSPHWKELKAEKARRTKKRCSICATHKNIDCHHLTYRNLHDVKMSDLRWLCRRCHDLTHQLMKDGTIHFKPGANHHSRFALTKTAVKKHLGITKQNLFWPAKRLQIAQEEAHAIESEVREWEREAWERFE